MNDLSNMIATALLAIGTFASVGLGVYLRIKSKRVEKPPIKLYAVERAEVVLVEETLMSMSEQFFVLRKPKTSKPTSQVQRAAKKPTQQSPKKFRLEHHDEWHNCYS